MSAPLTVLGRTLVRVGRHAWRWSDGTPEPRVRDLSPDVWNFRCRTYGSGETFVEVLRGVAQETDALRWVIDGARAGRYRTGESGDHAGPLDLSTGRRMHVRPGDDPLLGHLADAAPLRGPIPRVILVPVSEWDAWAEANPAGAEWAAEDEPALLQRAYDLGWRPGEGYVSPRGWRAEVRP